MSARNRPQRTKYNKHKVKKLDAFYGLEKGKRNDPPRSDSQDQDKMSNSFKIFMKQQELMKSSTSKKKRKRRNQRAGESLSDFNKRVSVEAVKSMRKINSAGTREKQKRRKLEKQRKQIEKEHDKAVDERLQLKLSGQKEQIQFGEVAAAPPVLTKPRGLRKKDKADVELERIRTLAIESYRIKKKQQLAEKQHSAEKKQRADKKQQYDGKSTKVSSTKKFYL